MILTNLIKQLFGRPSASTLAERLAIGSGVPASPSGSQEPETAQAEVQSAIRPGIPTLLNINGDKMTKIPDAYRGWNQLLFDTPSPPGAEVSPDASLLAARPASEFDSVFCTRHLESYPRSQVPQVLRAIHHVLKDDGFVDIYTPDLSKVVAAMAQGGLDIDDVLYEDELRKVSVHEAIYGGRHASAGADIGGNLPAHRCGFTAKSITAALKNAGFSVVHLEALDGRKELRALGFKREPAAHQRATLSLRPRSVS